MAYEQRVNSGTLFKNDKGDNEKRPDYRGDLNVNGAAFEVSGWIKSGAKGKFMSLSIKPKEAQQKPPEVDRGRQQSRNDFDDGSDVPF